MQVFFEKERTSRLLGGGKGRPKQKDEEMGDVLSGEFENTAKCEHRI